MGESAVRCVIYFTSVFALPFAVLLKGQRRNIKTEYLGPQTNYHPLNPPVVKRPKVKSEFLNVNESVHTRQGNHTSFM